MTARLRLLKLATVAIGVFACVACWTDPRVVWSPDGRQAAVIAADGLHLMDGDGNLSPLLAAGVTRAAWFADSQRLALSVSRTVSDFPSLTAALGPEATKLLIDNGEIAWQQFQAPDEPMELGDRVMALTGVSPFQDGRPTAIGWYLRERYADALREKFGEGSEPEEASTISLNSLVVARVAGSRLEQGTPLHTDFEPFLDIRPAPGGQAVAFVTHSRGLLESDRLTTRIVSAGGGQSAAIVATLTGSHPDWSLDGRSLVYLAADPRQPYIGSLVKRDVLDADGHIDLAASPASLLELIFSNETRVRCLPNGLMMFNARELRFPAVSGRSQEQLFAFDSTHAMLTPLVPGDQLARLPELLSDFEPSPDAVHVLIGGSDGEVLLLSTVDGRAEWLETGFEGRDTIPMPAWRRTGEFVYLKKDASRIELILHQGATDRVLSAEWPANVLHIVK